MLPLPRINEPEDHREHNRGSEHHRTGVYPHGVPPKARAVIGSDFGYSLSNEGAVFKTYEERAVVVEAVAHVYGCRALRVYLGGQATYRRA